MKRPWEKFTREQLWKRSEDCYLQGWTAGRNEVLTSLQTLKDSGAATAAGAVPDVGDSNKNDDGPSPSENQRRQWQSELISTNYSFATIEKVGRELDEYMNLPALKKQRTPSATIEPDELDRRLLHVMGQK